MGFGRADERSVIRRMSGPHTADNAALIRPTVGVIFGNNRISTVCILESGCAPVLLDPASLSCTPQGLNNRGQTTVYPR